MPTNSGSYVDPQRARIHQATVTLTDAQIKALPTLISAPGGEVVVPAAGSGIAIVLMSARIQVVLVAPYDNLTGDPVIYGLSFNGDRFAGNAIPVDVLTVGSLRIVTIEPRQYVNVDGIPEADADGGTDINVPLVFSLYNEDNTPLTGGDPGNTMKITALYMLLNTDTGTYQ